MLQPTMFQKNSRCCIFCYKLLGYPKNLKKNSFHLDSVQSNLNGFCSDQNSFFMITKSKQRRDNGFSDMPICQALFVVVFISQSINFEIIGISSYFLPLFITGSSGFNL
jgi:hypothetical protein